MTLQNSGAISLNQIHIEAGGYSGTTASLNDADIRGLIGKSSGATMSFNEWYGAANTFTYTISSNTQELNLTSTYFTNVGWNGSSNIILTIGSGVYIWSDSTSTAGLTITSSLNGKLTIVNNGYIIGKGGRGGYASSGTYNGQAGGPAIANSATGVSITNSLEAYIAGGGGGGAAQSGGDNTRYAGGGGGAGGGNGGGGYNNAGATTGGAIGQVGESSYGGPYGDGGTLTAAGGGGAGGGGGAYDGDGGDKTDQAGGAGGRILGSGATGGAGGISSQGPDGRNGGANGDAGTNGGAGYGGGGGGGWGATGGNSYSYSGGSGGAAISGTSVTLTNNGTIYGTY